MLEEVDIFVMGTGSDRPARKAIENVTATWWLSIEPSIGVKLNVRHINPSRESSGLQFPIDTRQIAFTCSGTEIFILTDNDMLPFTGEHVMNGLQAIEDNKSFAILSAWPDPAKFANIKLKGRDTLENDTLLETYSCGGMRFCRKIPSLKCPQVPIKGYDGVFCRHLWDEHAYRVGYLKESRAFHLGNNCTTLWTDG